MPTLTWLFLEFFSRLILGWKNALRFLLLFCVLTLWALNGTQPPDWNHYFFPKTLLCFHHISWIDLHCILFGSVFVFQILDFTSSVAPIKSMLLHCSFREKHSLNVFCLEWHKELSRGSPQEWNSQPSPSPLLCQSRAKARAVCFPVPRKTFDIPYSLWLA